MGSTQFRKKALLLWHSFFFVIYLTFDQTPSPARRRDWVKTVFLLCLNYFQIIRKLLNPAYGSPDAVSKFAIDSNIGFVVNPERKNEWETTLGLVIGSHVLLSLVACNFVFVLLRFQNMRTDQRWATKTLRMFSVVVVTALYPTVFELAINPATCTFWSELEPGLEGDCTTSFESHPGRMIWALVAISLTVFHVAFGMLVSLYFLDINPLNCNPMARVGGLAEALFHLLKTVLVVGPMLQSHHMLYFSFFLVLVAFATVVCHAYEQPFHSTITNLLMGVIYGSIFGASVCICFMNLITIESREAFDSLFLGLALSCAGLGVGVTFLRRRHAVSGASSLSRKSNPKHYFENPEATNNAISSNSGRSASRRKRGVLNDVNGAAGVNSVESEEDIGAEEELVPPHGISWNVADAPGVIGAEAYEASADFFRSSQIKWGDMDAVVACRALLNQRNDNKLSDIKMILVITLENCVATPMTALWMTSVALFVLKDLVLAGRLLKNIDSSRLHFGESFVRFALEEKMGSLESTRMGGSMSTVGMKEVAHEIELATKFHLDAVHQLRLFWSITASASGDNEHLDGVLTGFDIARSKASEAFETLKERFPSWPEVMRANAQFLSDACCDYAGSAELLTRADLADSKNGKQKDESEPSWKAPSHGEGPNTAPEEWAPRLLHREGNLVINAGSTVRWTMIVMLLVLTASFVFMDIFMYSEVARNSIEETQHINHVRGALAEGMLHLRSLCNAAAALHPEFGNASQPYTWDNGSSVEVANDNTMMHHRRQTLLASIQYRQTAIRESAATIAVHVVMLRDNVNNPNVRQFLLDPVPIRVPDADGWWTVIDTPLLDILQSANQQMLSAVSLPTHILARPREWIMLQHKDVDVNRMLVFDYNVWTLYLPSLDVLGGVVEANLYGMSAMVTLGASVTAVFLALLAILVITVAIRITSAAAFLRSSTTLSAVATHLTPAQRKALAKRYGTIEVRIRNRLLGRDTLDGEDGSPLPEIGDSAEESGSGSDAGSGSDGVQPVVSDRKGKQQRRASNKDHNVVGISRTNKSRKKSHGSKSHGNKSNRVNRSLSSHSKNLDQSASPSIALDDSQVVDANARKKRVRNSPNDASHRTPSRAFANLHSIESPSNVRRLQNKYHTSELQSTQRIASDASVTRYTADTTSDSCTSDEGGNTVHHNFSGLLSNQHDVQLAERTPIAIPQPARPQLNVHSPQGIHDSAHSTRTPSSDIVALLVEPKFVGIGILLGEHGQDKVIRSVVPEGPADLAGIRVGDEIVDVHGVIVSGPTGVNLQSCSQLLKGLPGSIATIRTRRADGNVQLVRVTRQQDRGGGMLPLAKFAHPHNVENDNGRTNDATLLPTVTGPSTSSVVSLISPAAPGLSPLPAAPALSPLPAAGDGVKAARNPDNAPTTARRAIEQESSTAALSLGIEPQVSNSIIPKAVVDFEHSDAPGFVPMAPVNIGNVQKEISGNTMPTKAVWVLVLELLVPVVCMIVFSVVAWNLIGTASGTSPSGAHYKQVQALLADISPPACFAINFYLKALTLPKLSEQARRRVLDDIFTREQHLLERIREWSSHFQDAHRRAWVSRIAVSAAGLRWHYHEELIPAIVYNDLDAIEYATERMTQKFMIHEGIVREVFEESSAELTEFEGTYDDLVSRAVGNIAGATAGLILVYVLSMPLLSADIKLPSRIRDCIPSRVKKTWTASIVRKTIQSRMFLVCYVALLIGCIALVCVASAFLVFADGDIYDQVIDLRSWNADIQPPEAYLIAAVTTIVRSVRNKQKVDLAEWENAMQRFEDRYSFWSGSSLTDSQYLQESLMVASVTTGRAIDQHVVSKLAVSSSESDIARDTVELYTLFEEHTRVVERSAVYLEKEILLATMRMTNLQTWVYVAVGCSALILAAAFACLLFVLKHNQNEVVERVQRAWKTQTRKQQQQQEEKVLFVGRRRSNSPVYMWTSVQVACWIALVSINLLVALLPLRHLGVVEDTALFVNHANRLSKLFTISHHLVREAALDDRLIGNEGVHLARVARTKIFEAKSLFTAFRSGGNFRLGTGTDGRFPEVDKIMYEPPLPQDVHLSEDDPSYWLFKGGLAHTYIATMTSVNAIAETIAPDLDVNGENHNHTPLATERGVDVYQVPEICGLLRKISAQHGATLLTMLRVVRPYVVSMWVRVEEELNAAFVRLFDSLHMENRLLFAIDVCFTVIVFFWFMFKRIQQHLLLQIEATRRFVQFMPLTSLPSQVTQSIRETLGDEEDHFIN